MKVLELGGVALRVGVLADTSYAQRFISALARINDLAADTAFESIVIHGTERVFRRDGGDFGIQRKGQPHLYVDAVCVCVDPFQLEHSLAPFSDRALLSVRNAELPLWSQMMDPRWSNLFVIGLMHPDAAYQSALEAQAMFVKSYFAGRNALPSQTLMERDMVEMHERRRTMSNRFARHLLEFDCEKYSSDLRHTMTLGAKRADAIGNPRPITSRRANAGCVSP